MRLAGLALCLVAARAVAEEPSLAHYLPADTPVYFEARSPSAEEMKRLAMARVFDDPRMKALLERARGDETSISTMRVPMGAAVVAIRSDLMSTEDVLIDVAYVDPKGERRLRVRNRIAAAVVGFPAGPMPLDLVVAVEVESDPREAALVVERILAAASLHARADEEGDIDAEIARLVTRAEHAGIAYASAALGPFRICLAPVGNLLIVASSDARMKDVLERRAGGAAASLATDARHVAALASIPGEGTHTTRFLLHVDRAVAKLKATRPEIGTFAEQTLLNLGLRDLESVTTVARVSGEGVRASTSVLLAPAARRGGLGRLFEKGGKPPSLGGLAYAPADSYYVNCGALDLPGLYRTAMELSGYQLAKEVAMPVQRDFGLRLKEDLIDLMGPEVTLVVAPNRGLVPDVALVLESSDVARLEANLLRMLSRVKWPAGLGVSDFRLRDVTVHAIPLGHPELGAVPLAPTFGVVDGRLVVAPFPLAFQRILAVKRGDRPSIADNRDFARLRELVPAEVQGVSYLDLARIFELVYDTFVPFVQAMSPGSGPSQLYEFPDVETLSRHLFGRVAWRTSDERGLRWESYSSIDMSSFALSLLAGASAALYFVKEEMGPGEATGGEPPQEIGGPARLGAGEREARLCRHRTTMLRARLGQFQHQHGRLPGSLDEIKDLPAEELLVPGGSGGRYVYLGPKGEGLVLLHGAPNGADGCICVITTGLKVVRVSEEGLARMKAGEEAR